MYINLRICQGFQRNCAVGCGSGAYCSVGPTRAIADMLRVCIAEAVGTPFARIVQVECILQGCAESVLVGFVDGDGGFLVNLQFSTGQQRSRLRDVHITGQNANLHVVGNGQVVVGRLHINVPDYKRVDRKVQIAQVGGAVDLIDLFVVRGIIAFAHPCSLAVILVVHKEHSMRCAYDLNRIYYAGS